jgi:hypothetical protein
MGLARTAEIGEAESEALWADLPRGDPDLVSVIAAWKALREDVKRAIVEIVDRAKSLKGSFTKG